MTSLLRGTRWPAILRESLGALHRELAITLTPVVRPRKWVFIVGCYNSGTELLAELLREHSQISVLPKEGQFLTDQLPADYELGLPRMWTLREDLFRLNEAAAGPNVVRLKKEWLMRLNRSKPVFVEKSPPNAARTRWLQQNFEDAHFVAIVRNGYAVSEGIQRKAEPHHLACGWPLQLCARQWSRSYEVLLEDAHHLRRITWIRYEDLVGDPRTELVRILRFLELDVDGTAAVDPQRSWSVHEKNEPIRDMNAESIGRLSEEDRRVITREASSMLVHFGYELLA